MKSIFFSLFLLVMLLVPFGPVSFADTKLTTPESASSTLDDQTGVSLTIYNADLGLVKDQRKVKLSKGVSSLRFMEVASRIIASSVQIRSLAAAEGFQVLEQNYEYDLLDPRRLLDKYVGKEVKLLTKNAYTDHEQTVTATLLSNNEQPIFRIGNEITFGHPGRIIFPGVPEDLSAKPTLVWLLENGLSSVQKIEASYLTTGITWRSDYIVTLNDRDDTADLSGWVTIDNKSGTTYRNARLKLVAGDVHQTTDDPGYRDRVMRYAAMEARTPAPQFREGTFLEYHIYSLERAATIRDSQSKQIRLVRAAGVPVRKELILRGDSSYYLEQDGSLTPDQKIGVFLEIENRKEKNLGIPLPNGTVRVYKADSEGSLQFAGEDRIDHTAKDEKIRIKLGDAFDAAGTRKITDWKKLLFGRTEAAYEVSIRNHKKEDIVVKVIEPIPGDWTMVNSSHPFKKTEAFTAEFTVPVPKDQEVKLTYRVRMRY